MSPTLLAPGIEKANIALEEPSSLHLICIDQKCQKAIPSSKRGLGGRLFSFFTRSRLERMGLELGIVLASQKPRFLTG